MTTRAIRRATRDVLGITRLRAGQAAAIESVLDRDTLAVLASGTGKTLVYHVAAKLLPGTTLVVSPTIALQHDQLRALQAGGAGAALLNADLGARQRRAVLADFAAGRIEFLLLAPEQLANDEVVAELHRSPISLAVVDEAHCVADWGHDFRPDYLALAAAFRGLGRPRLLALTATASPRVRAEVVERLGMRDAAVVVRGADRPNIWLGVDLVGSADAKRDALVGKVRAALPGPGIVYAATHRRTEELAALLREHGTAAVRYHGGLSRAERSAAHQAFMSGDVPVIVATSAFGMGVDKPDVRFVFHTEPPDSLDAYYQEIGRAGRDGAPARAELLYLPADLHLPRFFASGAGPAADELVRVLAAVAGGPIRPTDLAAEVGVPTRRATAAVNVLEELGALRRRRDRRIVLTASGRDVPPEAAAALAAQRQERQRQYAVSAVEMMRAYADTPDCRRRIILELLGEEHPRPCRNCDNCDRGAGSARAAGRPVRTERPFRLGARVRHPEWGDGSVQTYQEDDRVVVLFDDVGYKTLALAVIADHHLLSSADHGDVNVSAGRDTVTSP